MKDITYKIIETKDIFDWNDVHFYIGDERVEYCKTYQGKRSGLVCIERCPSCHKENWAMAVASGQCAMCGFNPNAQSKE